MIKTFYTFIEENPICKKFENSKEMCEIYGILSKHENVIKMVEFAEAGKPAICPCLDELEEYSEKNNFVLDDEVKKTVGRMIRTILVQFGYTPTSPKKIPQHYETSFVTASCYQKTEKGELEIVKTIKKSNS